MKTTILFIGALLMLMTTPSYAQEPSKKQKKVKAKVERVQKKMKVKPIKKRSIKVKKTTGTYEVNKPKVMTQTTVKPKKAIGVIKPQLTKVFKKTNFRDMFGAFELQTVNSGFEDSDDSTISRSEGKKKGDQFCTDIVLNTRLNTLDFKDFTLNGPPEWMKPGIILNALDFVQNANVIEERYQRGPITISFSGGGSKIIDNPKKKSKINDGVKELLNSVSEFRPGALISYSYSEVHSMEELNYKVNGRYSNSFAGIAATLGMQSSSTKRHHYYLVEFQQTVFNLQVDGLEINEIFPEDDVDLSKYIYISRVNYGRKGYFMLKTMKSVEDFGASASASMSYLGNNAEVKSNINKISSDESTEVTAFYYGGSVQSAVNDIAADWKRKGRKPLTDYINGIDFPPAKAYPIGYELKNLHNQRIGMVSNNTQPIETCMPFEDIKLKVTLLQIQCETTQDGDNYADYGITQHVRYKANGNVNTPISTDIKKFNSACPPGNINTNWAGSTSLICGSINRQIHTSESNVTGQRSPNINNSIVFNITPDEANDKNAKFMIDTWVKEYSSNTFGRDDVVMNKDPRKLKVAIHDVLAILNGPKELNALEHYFDGGVSSALKFDNFDGTSLPLRKVNYPGKMILEGPIRARNRGSDLDEKAFVWMRFEIID